MVNAKHRYICRRCTLLSISSFLRWKAELSPTQPLCTSKCTTNRFHDYFVPFFMRANPSDHSSPQALSPTFCRAAKSSVFPLLRDCRTRFQWKGSYPRDPSRQSSLALKQYDFLMQKFPVVSNYILRRILCLLVKSRTIFRSPVLKMKSYSLFDIVLRCPSCCQ